jgi:hypothetical protein
MGIEMCNFKLDTSVGRQNAKNAIIDYFLVNAASIARGANVPWSETGEGLNLETRTPEWIPKMAEATILHWNTVSETQFENRDRLTDKEALKVKEVVSAYLRDSSVGNAGNRTKKRDTDDGRQ